MPHQLTGRPEGPLSATDKALPPQADGLTAEQFLATAPRLSSLATPLLTLSEPAIAANVETLAAWSSDHGIALSPHGKTTMSPVLWRRQLEAGAHSITVANYPQLRVAVAAGVRCIQVANDLVDPAALRWLTEAVDTDPELEVMVWADSLESVAVLREHFTGNRPLTVLAELGGAHGRTGARSVEVAVAIGRALAEAGNLRLGGVAGYEGALAHDPTPEAVAAVDASCAGWRRRTRRCTTRGVTPPTGRSCSPPAAAPTSTGSPQCSRPWRPTGSGRHPLGGVRHPRLRLSTRP
ncbi:hypothetical protein [Barrientosiimonas humi]|uniref:hypothetical protein n=1 Tax=Barrientosiimonas humi TaxID=999931 RepID=UPI001FD5C7D7|nr:hypothetical protein [Barrientosiimonas humi]